MKKRQAAQIRIGSTLSPELRPGKDIAERITEDMGATAVATRDLARYYALLEVARRRLRGRFTLRELEALGHALSGMALVEAPRLLYLAPSSVEESVHHEGLCDQAGIEDCEDFVARVRALELSEIYALVDAVGRYLALPREERGEAGWRKVGLTPREE